MQTSPTLYKDDMMGWEDGYAQCARSVVFIRGDKGIS